MLVILMEILMCLPLRIPHYGEFRLSGLMITSSVIFQKELMKFIKLSKSEKFNPKNVYGSYAGAIGLGQFMPSNYEAYGVDFNGDGKSDIAGRADSDGSWWIAESTG
mgnify:CR=1 FL=1